MTENTVKHIIFAFILNYFTELVFYNKGYKNQQKNTADM